MSENLELTENLRELLQTKNFEGFRAAFAGISSQSLQIEILISLLSPYLEASPKRLDLANELHSHLPDSPAKYLSFFCAAAFEGARGDVRRSDALMLQSLEKLCEVIARELPISELSISILMHSLYMDTDLALKFKKSDQWKSNMRLDFSIRQDVDWIFVVSCNGLYFDRFAEGYLSSLESLRSKLHIHFQIIQPTAETQPLFDRLQQNSKHSLSAEMETKVARPVYFICRRFQVAHDLLKKFSKPVFITDIDIKISPRVQELLEISPELYDVALFEFSEDYPMLTCHCSLVLLQPKADVIRLLDLFSLYTDKKIQEEAGLWMLDQCALFVLSRLAAQNLLSGVRNLKWRDLRELTHAKLEDFQAEQAPSTEKHSMRAKAFPDFGNLEILEISKEVLDSRLKSRAELS
jgi:hypothetical protein